jgi:hypothetical protein
MLEIELHSGLLSSAMESTDWTCLRQRVNCKARSPGIAEFFLDEAYAAVYAFVTRTNLPDSG